MTSAQTIILCFLYGWFPLFVQICLARDTLYYREKIIGDKSPLVSKGEIFEMGFFSPVNNSERTYLGIWYHQVPQTIVWVANRDNPIESGKGVLQIAVDGNLVVTNTHGDGTRYWSSNITGSSPENRTARLNDWGNLELRENEDVLWESFDHPTDTFLAGMTMRLSLEFTCWNNSQDPATGNYTFKLDENKDRFTILEGKSETYWESLQSETRFQWMFNASRNFVNYTLGNKSSTLEPHSVHSRGQRLVMNTSGNIQILKFDNESRQWNMDWEEPGDKCKIYNHCGNFMSCSIFQNEAPLCKCLPGFKENDAKKKGCVRESTLSPPCVRQDMAFLNLTMMKVGDPEIRTNESTEEQCQSKCFHMCPRCQAYSYSAPYSNLASIDRDYPCLIWTSNLVNLQEQTGQNNGGRDLSVPVKRSDIVWNGRSCEPCGTNIIPYPLSTGPNCGDPMYFNFTCNNLNGQLSFKMAEETFQVTQFRPNISSFIALANDSYNCDANHEEDHLFHVTCNNEKELEVRWEPPLEPACSNSTDCINWPHSTCETRGTRSMCLCLPNYHWNGSTLACMKEEPPTGTGNLPLILTLALISMIFLVCASIFAYFRRERKARKQDTGSIRGIQESLYDSERQVKGLIGLGELEGQDNEGIGVPFVNFETILAATENFSDANKLGRGGYGPVYKGRFLGGQDIAVKRLSSVSNQGLQEFKNEVVLIAKLQHRNLVRLRGYSIKEDEKVLLYEYMPNKSLDLFLFDRTQTVLLDWNLRFDIILGIARGLLYLHQDSRLRIIHRDLKTSNILLDEEMNPKISDFGLAKIFGGKETEASTERIVGTYGYMAPEYALDGMFSVKSDVFSFGVVLLEIISGKKNTGFYQSNKTSSLLGYAWRLWTENNLMDLMDSCLRGNSNSNQFVKCANIGLLCVQDEPSDRPTMSNIVMMLESEIATLPIPQQPTFFVRSSSNTASSSSKAESKLQIETSYLQGR